MLQKTSDERHGGPASSPIVNQTEVMSWEKGRRMWWEVCSGRGLRGRAPHADAFSLLKGRAVPAVCFIQCSQGRVVRDDIFSPGEAQPAGTTWRSSNSTGHRASPQRLPKGPRL